MKKGGALSWERLWSPCNQLMAHQNKCIATLSYPSQGKSINWDFNCIWKQFGYVINPYYKIFNPSASGTHGCIFFAVVACTGWFFWLKLLGKWMLSMWFLILFRKSLVPADGTLEVRVPVLEHGLLHVLIKNLSCTRRPWKIKSSQVFNLDSPM